MGETLGEEMESAAREVVSVADVVVAWLPELVAAALLMLAALLLAAWVRRALRRAATRSGLRPVRVELASTLAYWVIVALGAVLALGALGVRGLGLSLLAGGGIGAVILGFAFREIGENLLAGLFLAFSRPFDVGDLIRSGAHTGVVRDIRLRYTHVRTEDGRDVFIPNARVFNEALENYTVDGLRRLAFTAAVPGRAELPVVRERLREAVAGVKGVLSEPPVAVEATALAPGSVEITVELWVDALAGAASPERIRGEAVERVRRVLVDSGLG